MIEDPEILPEGCCLGSWKGFCGSQSVAFNKHSHGAHDIHRMLPDIQIAAVNVTISRGQLQFVTPLFPVLLYRSDTGQAKADDLHCN